jgi:hydrogenase/urease accessory protein HupE
MKTKNAILILLLFSCYSINAHDVITDLEQMTSSQAGSFYINMGFTHILPQGLDHILFIVCLCMYPQSIKTLTYKSLAFTLGHSISLALAVAGLISFPSSIVEPIIAVSIVYVVASSLFGLQKNNNNLWLILSFGLLHGLGFATALNQYNLPAHQFFLSIVGFNIGLELGQIVVIVSILLLKHLISKYNNRLWLKIQYTTSYIVLVVGLFWFFERI